MRCILLAVTVLALSACAENDVQTTSGADYLSRYAPVTSNLSKLDKAVSSTRVTDAAVREAAAVEPILRFPARIGIARIENRQLTNIPQGEAEVWSKLAKKHQRLGKFVPISPLIAEFTEAAILSPSQSQRRWRNIGEVVSMIRLGAARQHVDAVLLYEVYSKSSKANTPLAFVDVTIIGGAILPTRSLKAYGAAQALLLDVRNGYPYGTARAEADLSEFTVSYGSDQRNIEIRHAAGLKVIENLAPEIEEMMQKLIVEMAARKPGKGS